MKLLFYISSLSGGGAERVMCILCNELVRRGHKVHIATDTRLEFAYPLDNEIKIHDFFEKSYVIQNRLDYHLTLHRRIRLIAKDVKPDIIITFMWKLNVHTLLALTGLSFPVIASEHFTFDKKFSLYEYLVRFQINKLADKVTVLTKQDFDILGKRLKNKIVMPNPVPYKIYDQTSARTQTVLAVGSIDRWKHKGFDNLIQVWARLSDRNQDWTLEIAGSGTEDNVNYLKSIISKYNVVKSTRLLGFQKEMDKLMQRSAVFVLSSRYEGLPMALIEAMSQGCACVSFDCKSGPKEIITDKENGLLVEDQDLDQMEIALSTVMENQRLRETLSSQGTKKAEDFSSVKIVDKWESIFRELI